MGLVCNWLLCVHNFYSIMPKGKISTFVVLSIVIATIFSIGEYNWIYASPLQCCCVIKWKVEYLDPFEKKNKKARDFVFLHHINPFEIWKWSQWIFFLIYFFLVVWSFGNLPFGFQILCWVCPRIGPIIVELGSCYFSFSFFGSQYKKLSYIYIYIYFFFSFKQFDFRNEVLSRTPGVFVCGLSLLIIL